MSERFRVTHVDEVEGYAEEGRPSWRMIRAVFGVEAFGVNAWTATGDGQTIISEHDELGGGAAAHEELYVVLSGSATFMLDGEAAEAQAGTLVFVKDPAVKRSAVAATAGTTVLVVGARPGVPFTVSPWESSAEALRFWTTGEWDKAIELLSTQHRENPENAGTLYNLACAEARGGRGDDALAHLAQSIKRESRFLENAQGDPDLESIRADPRFPRP